MTALAEVLRKVMEHRLADVRVAIPGRVESYDAATQTAEIQPLIKEITETDTGNIVEQLPKLPSVPVAFPRGGGFFVSFPIAKNDTGMLVICDRSIDQWCRTGEISDPLDFRKHDISNAVFYPGLSDGQNALADAHADNMVMGKDGGKHIHMKSGEIALGVENPTDHVALASLTKAELQTIITALLNHGHNTTATVGPSAVLGLISAPIQPALGVPPVSAIIPSTPGDVKSATVKSE